VERIAALGDRAALAELDERHGLSLYALAYSLVLDPLAADAAVSATFREVWRSAALFFSTKASVRQWLADLIRRTARRHRVPDDGLSNRLAAAWET
jgi:DNA-directed RNA polymerase specialized sigma24 family protein